MMVLVPKNLVFFPEKLLMDIKEDEKEGEKLGNFIENEVKFIG